MTGRKRAPLAGLGNLTPEGVEYARALEREAERSLERDPSRWRWQRSGDPDHPRAKPRRAPWRKTS